ncbi:Alpha/Beta hydrolase protein [Tirmania nivea]|nr:Alpha/Beta hydrolase protein [Tirmania nivea]
MSFAFSNLRSSFLLPAAVISAVGLSSYLLLSCPPCALSNHIPSPRTKLSSLTEDEIAKLPYPPTFYPGGRWVKTPHGTIRVYEFGPEDGRKVLLVHGISTPCCVYRDLAWRLVEEGGCRVMLFDLYGRGWSDSPVDRPHDSILYNSQIHYALLSSPLPWLSPHEFFSVIGYSLGGCLVPSFILSLPEAQLASISSVVLLAPAGLLQAAKMSTFTKLAYNGWLPTAVQTFIAKRFMRKGVQEFSVDNTDQNKTLDLDSIAGWQASTHEGYLPAWISSFRYCPIFDSREMFTEFRNLVDTDAFGAKEENGRVYIFMAGEDSAVRFDEVVPAMKEILHPKDEKELKREGHIKWKVWEGAEHEMVARSGSEIAREILVFWGVKERTQEQVPLVDMEQSWVQA